MNFDIDTIKFYNKVFCFNQLQITEYDFIADEKHKQIKELSRKNHNKDLTDKLISLDEYLYEKFGYIFDVNCKYIYDFFKLRKNSLPRICLKITIGENIVTLYRNPEYPFANNPFRFDENKAFLDISTGKQSEYLCNDIPAAIVDGTYHNKRIVKDKAIEYKKDDNSQKFGLETFDMKWVECWEKVSLTGNSENQLVYPPPKTCYKSTLVVPLSLANEEMTEEFRKHLKIPNTPCRAIFGFLCLDHHTTNFFDRDTDISFLYFFADLLSIYLIKQINNTQRSSAYSKVFSEVKHQIDKDYDMTQQF